MTRYLYRDGDQFAFRRRVPEQLQTRLGQKEIYRSLKTSVRRTAQQRAAALYLRCEKVFGLSEYAMTDEDFRAAAKSWLSTNLWSRRLEAVDKLTPGVLRARMNTLAGDMLEAAADHLRVSPDTASHMEAGFALEYADYDDGNVENVQRCRIALMNELQAHVDKRVSEVFHIQQVPTAQSNETVAKTPSVKILPSPKALDHVDAWQEALVTGWGDWKGIDGHSARQYGVAVKLLSEMFGDRQIGEFTHDDAADFRKKLLKLPASLGKGRHVHALTAIENAERLGSARMSMKTVKRHMTALNRYWGWLCHEGLLSERQSPFAGHSFPGTKSNKSNRDDWSVEDLERLFKSSDYRMAAPNSALRWLPLIALHSGMRLEEMCRLRPAHDVVSKNKIPCFVVQRHPDGWDPKTEAGEREVPIHSWLVRQGLLDLVEARRNEGCGRLFPELRPNRDGKISASFSRDFSRLKTGLSIGKKTTFHSFRHSFRTILESTDFQERHINAVLGHEGEGRGEGGTYGKRITTKKLQEVVEAVESPLPLTFLQKS